MGITYLGPVDGHNVEEMAQVLKEARRVRHAVLVMYGPPRERVMARRSRILPGSTGWIPLTLKRESR